MDSKRQKKISNLLKETLGEILQRGGGNLFPSKVLVSVTNVMITPDLSVARVYLSIFNADKNEEIMDTLQENLNEIRHQLGNKLRNHLRKVPILELYMDDSLEQADKIKRIFKEINKKDEDAD